MKKFMVMCLAMSGLAWGYTVTGDTTCPVAGAATDEGVTVQVPAACDGAKPAAQCARDKASDGDCSTKDKADCSGKDKASCGDKDKADCADRDKKDCSKKDTKDRDGAKKDDAASCAVSCSG